MKEKKKKIALGLGIVFLFYRYSIVHFYFFLLLSMNKAYESIDLVISKQIFIYRLSGRTILTKKKV
jgi:hypothetical protein